jgi:hypothetical protein
LADIPAAITSDTHFQLAMNHKGNAALIWSDSDKHIFVSTLASGEKAWAAPLQLTAENITANFPQVVIDEENNIIAAWENNTEGDQPWIIKSAIHLANTTRCNRPSTLALDQEIML